MKLICHSGVALPSSLGVNRSQVVATSETIKLLRVMKISILLLTVCCLHAGANSIAQVTYSGKNVTLDEIFTSVSKQTGYKFFYSPTDLKNTRRITINVKNISIDDLMKQVLAGQNLEYSIEDKTVFVTPKKNEPFRKDDVYNHESPPINVRGRVINEKGDPVAGVSIMIKGTQRGTYTNSDGEFTLYKVDPSATLILTAVNIKPIEANIIGRQELTLQVNGKTGKLDEVQVIAYGKTSQRFNTGNVTSIKAEDIEKQPVTNPLLALQGRVPGLNVVQHSGLPGTGITIQIRGQNSINSGNDPLYIVDGVPLKPSVSGIDGQFIYGSGLVSGILGNTPSAFAYINPGDVESIEILKDADATAIYGSRGANGVILITTKKGRIGKTQINFNLQHGFGKVPKKLDYMNTQQYLLMRNEAFKNDNLIPSANPGASGSYRFAPDLMMWDTMHYTDWQKELIGGTAKFVNLQASASGGNSTMQYLIGANYNMGTTVYPGDFSNKKGGIHFSLTGRSVNQKLKVTLTGSYMSDNNKLPKSDFTTFINLAPNAPVPFKGNGSLNWAEIAPGGQSTFENPYALTKKPFDVNINNLMSSFLVSYRLLPNLDFSTSLGYNLIQSESYSAEPFASIDPFRWIFSTRSSSFSNSSARSLIVEPQVNYDLNFQQHTIRILIGGTWQQNKTSFQRLDARGFISDNAMKNIEAATTIRTQYATTQYKYAAAFGQVNYRLQNRYLFNFNIRRDASSRFGPGNQYATFASVGTGWILSETSLFKQHLSPVSFFKLRLSYGTTGNDQIGDYKYLDIYTYLASNNGGLYQGARGLGSNGLFNPYYSWEITKKLEGGLDLGFFKDRILINVSYYRNRTSNQLISASLPNYVGPGSMLVNLPALVQNDGWEFTINTTNIKTKNFTWTSAFNTSLNRNRLLKEYDPLVPGNVAQVKDPKALGFGMFFKLLGIDPATGLYYFEDKGGLPTTTPTEEDRTVYFNLRFPRYFGGLQNTFGYKSISLDIFIAMVKQQAQAFLPNTQPGYGTFNHLKSVLDGRWQKPGDIATQIKFSRNITDVYANYTYAKANSSLGYEDASYIRIKNISLSWEIPSVWKKRIKIQDLRIYCHGQNLLTFTKYRGLDPENLNSSTLPPLRIISFGIQATL